MDRAAIKGILPHREPMLLLDEVELAEGSVHGRYTVRGDEFFLQGHFPGNPVLPGVMLCEMMAQSACLLVEGTGEKFTPFFTGIKNAKFKNVVRPGDIIDLVTELVARKGNFYFVKSQALVDGRLCASGELSFAIVEGE
ncbi:MAG: 3-hydroxyacyl-ACP dehydratase FabZ [Coriobacteriia bacterium]|nr:3-hydroxyacyl-ACP dehydratase FabZ [Coriobacteriia bacterium]